mmetsp:Transcript_96687/g.268801  ORF Transcript_96687/g.268801 Transcript_96687/m.268801 type:complete len:312 (-) Transcript_96687:36-971(-)
MPLSPSAAAAARAAAAAGSNLALAALTDRSGAAGEGGWGDSPMEGGGGTSELRKLALPPHQPLWQGPLDCFADTTLLVSPRLPERPALSPALSVHGRSGGGVMLRSCCTLPGTHSETRSNSAILQHLSSTPSHELKDFSSLGFGWEVDPEECPMKEVLRQRVNLGFWEPVLPEKPSLPKPCRTTKLEMLSPLSCCREACCPGPRMRGSWSKLSLGLFLFRTLRCLKVPGALADPSRGVPASLLRLREHRYCEALEQGLDLESVRISLTPLLLLDPERGVVFSSMTSLSSVATALPLQGRSRGSRASRISPG